MVSLGDIGLLLCFFWFFDKKLLSISLSLYFSAEASNSIFFLVLSSSQYDRVTPFLLKPIKLSRSFYSLICMSCFFGTYLSLKLKTGKSSSYYSTFFLLFFFCFWVGPLKVGNSSSWFPYRGSFFFTLASSSFHCEGIVLPDKSISLIYYCIDLFSSFLVISIGANKDGQSLSSIMIPLTLRRDDLWLIASEWPSKARIYSICLLERFLGSFESSFIAFVR